ncbi:hypothetical protein ACJIZ3_003541 [Penstemon smallii]|uniref:Uncharacterized protein n=1 Tax=Penstemon smallii TaxID=265156 RepID=A0ABD3UDD1_9LAMI
MPMSKNRSRMLDTLSREIDHLKRKSKRRNSEDISYFITLKINEFREIFNTLQGYN